MLIKTNNYKLTHYIMVGKTLFSFLILSTLLNCYNIVKSEENGILLFAEKETNFAELIKNGGSIKVNPNQKFAFTIVSNPTTGYEWNLHKDSLNGFMSSIDPDEHGTFESGGEHAGWMGVPGHQIFTFQSKYEGIENIELTYERKFEHADSRGHYTLEVVIEE